MTRPRARMSALRSITCLMALAATAAAQSQAAQNKEIVQNARTLLQQRAEAWQVITKERADWKLGREILTDRIGMAKRETEGLRGKTAEADQNITEADRKTEELVTVNEALKQASASLEQPIVALEQRTLNLVKRLPQPLIDHLALMTQRIPTDAEKAKGIRLAVRFGTVVAVLQEIDKWNQTITIAPELIELGSGQRAEVTAMYLGVGQGYYVAPDGKHAGIGTAGGEGWSWTPADDAAPRIELAIDIYNKKQTAAFVKLPVRIQ
ncbi:MAG: DUF3450 family protein [Planctomycetes bacterium]|nr:DUF3450 family protein [Planctomycetota bacterium]